MHRNHLYLGAAILASAIALLPLPALSQALIMSEEHDGSVTRTWLQGDQVRIQGESDAYLLLDTRFERFDAVFPDRDVPLDLTADLPPRRELDDALGEPVPALESRGPGPSVAGYPTERYLVVGSGRNCGEVLLSREALERTGAIDYLRTKGNLQQRQRLASPPSNRGPDACARALEAAAGQYDRKGLPMRITDADGTLRHQVISIQGRVDTPPGFFDPPGFRRDNAAPPPGGADY